MCRSIPGWKCNTAADRRRLLKGAGHATNQSGLDWSFKRRVLASAGDVQRRRSSVTIIGNDPGPDLRGEHAKMHAAMAGLVERREDSQELRNLPWFESDVHNTMLKFMGWNM